MGSAKTLTAQVDEIGDKIVAWAFSGTELNDKPVQGFPLAKLSSALAVVASYLTFVLLGTALVRLTPGNGIKLYGLSFTYNIVQVMLCAYMCIEAAMLATRNNYSLVCNRFDLTNPPVAKVLWLFYMSKVLDFADTFFIVVGKKWKQLSFLHVYHHSTIFLVYWLNLHVNFDGDVYLTIILNGLIHTVMYTYYFVSMHTKDIWWKKYLTLAQLVQFVCMNVQAMYILVTGCSEAPPRVTAIYLVYILSLFTLFMHFYKASYTKNKPKSS